MFDEKNGLTVMKRMREIDREDFAWWMVELSAVLNLVYNRIRKAGRPTLDVIDPEIQRYHLFSTKKNGLGIRRVLHREGERDVPLVSHALRYM